MSFSNTLNRLREAAKGQKGRNGDVSVSAYDLRDLLNDYDRIDAKLRNQFQSLPHPSTGDAKQIDGII